MLSQFKKIGILGKPSDPSIAATLDILCRFLDANNHQVFIDSNSAQFVNNTLASPCELKNLGEKVDLLIAVGGDGTFLTGARTIALHNIPLIGVNLGRLGFLVDISPEELTSNLIPILNGKFIKEERYLLRTKVIRNGETIHEDTAVNEVVVHRWVTPSMIEIITKINGVYLNSQRSDGLVISTPTGSTAYALSAGGPILHPALNALVLVPLNPHTLTNRPIVINDDAEIELSFCQTKQINALVTCDSVEIPEVLISDKILIKKEPNPITILHPEQHEFFHILREKLDWSAGYHN
ncbi:MAG: NAD(+) kinase [Methylococcales bacterium]|nr:NAD(+) kinase [Methylococcales bacterium]